MKERKDSRTPYIKGVKLTKNNLRYIYLNNIDRWIEGTELNIPVLIFDSETKQKAMRKIKIIRKANTYYIEMQFCVKPKKEFDTKYKLLNYLWGVIMRNWDILKEKKLVEPYNPNNEGADND